MNTEALVWVGIDKVGNENWYARMALDVSEKYLMEYGKQYAPIYVRMELWKVNWKTNEKLELINTL